MRFFLILISGVTLVSCSCLSRLMEGHDKQFLQIYYHSGVTLLDTFHCIYRKDLVPGSATTKMWFTSQEQEILLTDLQGWGFFSMPDTLYKIPNAMQEPNPGKQTLRIKYKNREKTIVWYVPIEPKYRRESAFITNFIGLLNEIIVATPEYKALPPRKGLYG